MAAYSEPCLYASDSFARQRGGAVGPVDHRLGVGPALAGDVPGGDIIDVEKLLDASLLSPYGPTEYFSLIRMARVAAAPSPVSLGVDSGWGHVPRAKGCSRP